MKVAQELRKLAQDFNVDFEQLDPILVDVLLDISWFGDSNPTSHPIIESLIVGNDLQSAFQTMSDETIWIGSVGVPLDRFTRRKDYMTQECTHKLCSCPTAVCSFSCCETPGEIFVQNSVLKDIPPAVGVEEKEDYTITYDVTYIQTGIVALAPSLNGIKNVNCGPGSVEITFTTPFESDNVVKQMFPDSAIHSGFSSLWRMQRV
mmetsp:Transcript_44737/g.107980  ORF Transcript_44737/g.107980 Transcript_44737/m.107980 type:complete len:205 (-) Transcript_44737:1423-2037(-)